MAADLDRKVFIPYYDNLMYLLKSNEVIETSFFCCCNGKNTSIFQQMAFGALGTAVGSVVGGPVGGIMGGIAGCALGYKLSVDYQALICVLQNLSDENKKEIVFRVQNLVGSQSKKDLVEYVCTPEQRTALLNLLTNAISK